MSYDKRRKPIIIYIYNSFNDPLFKNLMYEHLLTLSREGKYNFFLITFEQPEFPLSDKEQIRIKQDLKEKFIYWFPKKFHTGKLLLIKKLYDFLSAFFLVAYLKVFKKASVIFSYANVASAQCAIFSKLLNLKFIAHTYEPHSSFMVDLGHWSKKSLNYRVLNTLENYVAKRADVIFTGTKYMVERLQEKKIKAQVYRAPTSVDESKFIFVPDARVEIRKKHKLEGRKVVVYLGKFGGLYYGVETIRFFKVLHAADPSFFFLIVTRDNPILIEEWLFQEKIKKESYMLTSSANYLETRALLSAADIGLNAVPPTPTQKYRSPFKIAEYLLCGLPYITCKGVSEDDIYAQEFKVGVVVNNFSEPEIEKVIPVIKNLIAEDGNLKEHCRKVGLEYRAKSNIDELFEKVLNNIF